MSRDGKMTAVSQMYDLVEGFRRTTPILEGDTSFAMHVGPCQLPNSSACLWLVFVCFPG